MRKIPLLFLVLTLAACGVEKPLIKPKDIPAYEAKKQQRIDQYEQEQRELEEEVKQRELEEQAAPQPAAAQAQPPITTPTESAQ